MRHVCYIVCKSSGLLAFLTVNIGRGVSGVGLPPSILIGFRESRALVTFSRITVGMILTRLHLVLLVVATLLLCLVGLTDQSGMPCAWESFLRNYVSTYYLTVRCFSHVSLSLQWGMRSANSVQGQTASLSAKTPSWRTPPIIFFCFTPSIDTAEQNISSCGEK